MTSLVLVLGRFRPVAATRTCARTSAPLTAVNRALVARSSRGIDARVPGVMGLGPRPARTTPWGQPALNQPDVGEPDAPDQLSTNNLVVISAARSWNDLPVIRRLDPRHWSFEARFSALVLVPVLTYVGLFRWSQGLWTVTLFAVLGVRWLVLPRWARRRGSRSAPQAHRLHATSSMDDGVEAAE
jgi:hypothetical protein